MSTGFLIVEGVKGESEKACEGYSDLIDLVHYSMGVNNTSRPGGGGWSSGEAIQSDFSFGLDEGTSSTKLEEFCAAGTHIAKVTVVLAKTIGGDDLKPYRIVEFTDCKISSYTESFAQGSAPMNGLALAYGAKKVEYKKQQTAGGELQNAASYGWDFKTQKKLV